MFGMKSNELTKVCMKHDLSAPWAAGLPASPPAFNSAMYMAKFAPLALATRWVVKAFFLKSIAVPYFQFDRSWGPSGRRGEDPHMHGTNHPGWPAQTLDSGVMTAWSL